VVFETDFPEVFDIFINYSHVDCRDNQGLDIVDVVAGIGPENELGFVPAITTENSQLIHIIQNVPRGGRNRMGGGDQNGVLVFFIDSDPFKLNSRTKIKVRHSNLFLGVRLKALPYVRTGDFTQGSRSDREDYLIVWRAVNIGGRIYGFFKLEAKEKKWRKKLV